MSDNKTKWGEDKLYFEEAIPGALMAGACGAAMVAPFVGAIPFQNIISGAFGVTEILTMSTIGVSMAGGFTLLGWQKSEWHYDGMEYIYDPKNGALSLQELEKALMTEDQKQGLVKGWEIGGVELSRTREVAHQRVVGLPGSGKTVYLKNVTYQILTRSEKEKLILHDPKGDFTQWLYDKLDTILLGPWDARATIWDISRDINTPALAISIARKVASDGVDSNSMSGSSKYFQDCVTAIFAGYLMYNMRRLGDNWSWDTISHDFMTGVMVDKARLGDPTVNTVLASGGKGEQMQNVVSALGAALSWIPSYAAAANLVNNYDGTLNREASGLFSLKQWMAGNENQHIRKIILNNNKNYERLAQQIFGLMLSCIESFVNSAEMPNISPDSENGIAMVIDEMPQLGVEIIKTLASLEELGRHKGVRVIKAMQDETQLTAILGRDKGSASNSVQQTRIYFKTAIETAAKVSKEFGYNSQIRVDTPEMAGSGNKRITKDDKHEVIQMSDFAGLKVLPGVGVEMIVSIDDSLVKLVQPFLAKEFSANKIDPETGKDVPQIIDNDRFNSSLLLIAADIEAMNEYEYLKSQGENPPQPVLSGIGERRVLPFVSDITDIQDAAMSEWIETSEPDNFTEEIVIVPHSFNAKLFDSFLLPAVTEEQLNGADMNEESESDIDFSSIGFLTESDIDPELLAVFHGSNDSIPATNY